MISIFKKEINLFFSSLIGYIVISVFLVFLGLMIWVFPDSSLLEYNYATLDQLFSMAPLIFLFLIPAITMSLFAEEKQTGTIELLATRPLTDLEIILGKYFAALLLVIFALIPTLLYYFTIYQLGFPKGNLDSGAIWGSYIGLVLLGASFVAIGIFASSLTTNQIVAFVLSSFLCFMFYWGFLFFSKFSFFVGTVDDLIQMLGIDYHYESLSRGVADTRDILYFISLIAIFLGLTNLSLDSRRW